MKIYPLLLLGLAACHATPGSPSTTVTGTSGTSAGASGSASTGSTTGSSTGSTAGATGSGSSGSSGSSGQGPTFFVSPSGDDANPGTAASPWKTLQHAASSSQVTPGTTVLARGGVYNEKVTFTVSGSADGGEVSFASFPGETAVVDGSGLSVTGQEGLFNIKDQSYLSITNFELRNLTDATATNVPIGILVQGHGDDLRIRGNHIHHISTTGPQTPGCTNTSGGVNSNALGLLVAGTDGAIPLTRVLIEGNELDHLVLGCSESLTLNGNVQFFQVMNNQVHDNNNIGIDAIGFEHVSPDPATDQARDGVIAGNSVYNIDTRGLFGLPPNGAYTDSSADGLYLDGAARVIVERNWVRNVDVGIELASETQGTDTSDSIARDNVVSGSVTAGISIGGYAANVGGTRGCSVVNNTLYQNDTRSSGSGELQIQNNAVNNIFKNNIVDASSQGIFVSAVGALTAAQVSFDNNLYFAPAGAPTLWTFNGGAGQYTSLPAFATATAMEGHGLAADPELVGPLANPQSATVFDLAATSPARGSGVDLGPGVVGTADFVGRPRAANGHIDIGAFEK